MANDPQRRSSRDPGQGESMHGSTERQHGSTAQGTATISRGTQPREEPPRRPPEPPHRPRFNPLLLLGLLGMLALGGLIAGLVASHNPVSHPVKHVPTTPVPPTTTHTLRTFALRGSGTSSSFTVPSSPVTARYGYSCPAGTTGHFIARMQNSSGSDVQNIVNSTATTGNNTVTLHPKHPGTPYHMVVTAPSTACGSQTTVSSTK